MKVGWIGLGAMGMPMATHLARTGFEVTGFDPNPAVAFPPEVNATLVPSAAEAATGADIVVVMVATPAQAMAAVGDALAGLAPGTPVVVTATIGPEAAGELSRAVSASGSTLVDAPVSGGVARAGTGDLLIMASGTEADLDAVAPLLDALSSRWHRVGPAAGDGQRMKLVNQLLCGVHIAAAGEALAYAQRLGITAEHALEVVSGGAAASFMLGDRGTRMAAEEFEPARSAIDIFVKDLGLVVGATALELPLASAALGRFERAHELGLGRRDDSSVILTYLDSTEEQS